MTRCSNCNRRLIRGICPNAANCTGHNQEKTA